MLLGAHLIGVLPYVHLGFFARSVLSVSITALSIVGDRMYPVSRCVCWMRLFVCMPLTSSRSCRGCWDILRIRIGGIQVKRSMDSEFRTAHEVMRGMYIDMRLCSVQTLVRMRMSASVCAETRPRQQSESWNASIHSPVYQLCRGHIEMHLRTFNRFPGPARVPSVIRELHRVDDVHLDPQSLERKNSTLVTHIPVKATRRGERI